MKYRIEFVGIREGAQNPTIILEWDNGERAAVDRFHELKAAAALPGAFVAWKLCLNLDTHIRWKNPILYREGMSPAPGNSGVQTG